jgi:hypothetical protein
MNSLRPWPHARQVFAGLGDLGTLVPYLLTYTLVVGMKAQVVLGSMGLLMVLVGLAYRMPMPVQPMKAVGALAIVAVTSGQQNVETTLMATSLLTAAVWLVLAYSPTASGLMKRLPGWLGHGISLLLGLAMVVSAAKGLWLGESPGGPAVVSTTLINPPVESVVGSWSDHWTRLTADPSIWSLAALWVAIQVPLTLGNACLATAAQSQVFFPDRGVTVRRLALSTAWMNVLTGLVGSFPVCHGVGGLAGYRMLGGQSAVPVVALGLGLLILGLWVPDTTARLLSAAPPWAICLLLAWAGLYLARSAYRALEQQRKQPSA